MTCLTSSHFIVLNPNCWSIDDPRLFPGGTLNFALRRPASQSSIHRHHKAGLAVDGNAESFSITGDRDFHLWWKVQLAYPVWVTHVHICSTSSILIIYFSVLSSDAWFVGVAISAWEKRNGRSLFGISTHGHTHMPTYPMYTTYNLFAMERFHLCVSIWISGIYLIPLFKSLTSMLDSLSFPNHCLWCP